MFRLSSSQATPAPIAGGEALQHDDLRLPYRKLGGANPPPKGEACLIGLQHWSAPNVDQGRVEGGIKGLRTKNQTRSVRCPWCRSPCLSL